PGSRGLELWEIVCGDGLQRERLLREVAGALMPSSSLAGPVPGSAWHRLRGLARNVNLRNESLLVIHQLALALRQIGDRAEAERLLRSAVAARPDEPILLGALGPLLLSHDPPRPPGA